MAEEQDERRIEIMEEVQTMSYATNLSSLNDIESIRKLLDNREEVEYWHIDINDPENKLMIMGKHLDEVVRSLKQNGYIVEID